MQIAIVGGGIGGLALALSLHQRGLRCAVYESVPQVREVGVGITLLPHAMRELQALGLHERLAEQGIENLESVFFNRWGQFIYREPRGRHAGYPLPEVGIHRGKLHRVLYDAVLERLGPQALHLDHRCVGLEQDAGGATLQMQASSGATTTVRADAVVACDGVNSALRRQFYPHEQLAFAGINTWRGVTVHRPILTGKSYLRIGSIETGKMVIYPIVDNVDGQGGQLVNWVAEIQRPGAAMNDWNKPGRPEDFLDIFADWRFEWLDVPALIRGASQIFEYPMVDRDPVPRWTFDRVTLLGDAAHPMYPRGSNGSAQALIDARVLADELAGAEPGLALARYQDKRLQPTARIVQTNRTVPPDFIIMRADELSGGKPFAGSVDDLISQDELRRISDDYKRVAGFSLESLQPTPPAAAG
ncbi:MAG TPA: flavin-dependent oxidoreductase [Ramlibacter sp.]|jgi:2-polyprenyl-6-methoxyphenol hydroxylase-like FAD-dependent oxidoreductase|uniref:flavin-dependent oxidoreductase n=1 Tax=Ramlibacter sp. TaxID=1917967 RepID=UPI002D495751|nr:flavin-dependent oxidoreductase [Ramlibacter sp.]HZY19343.1 flavin-dependent oxidoreductase [Ramlibacter sp.]